MKLRRGGLSLLPAASGSGSGVTLVTSASIGCAVSLQAILQFFPGHVGIAAGLLHVVGPGLWQRLGGLAPFAKLFRRDRVDLLARFGFDLGNAVVLEIGPWAADLARPFVGAMIIDHLLLGSGHPLVRPLVHRV